MIERFGPDTALLLIDVQVGVNDLRHWGGPAGRRNNPAAEDRQRALLATFRDAGLQVAFTVHDSREPDSPLRLSVPTGSQIQGLEPAGVDVVVVKHTNSGFVGTGLEVDLRRARINRLVVAGFFTNMCVDTTVRMAGNLGFDTYAVGDACATTNRVGPDGVDHDPKVVHDLSLASLHGEFCTMLSTDDAERLVSADLEHLDRVQGNEPASPPPAHRAGPGSTLEPR